MSAPKPLEQFTLTPCHPLRLAASSNNASLIGLLEPSDAQHFDCNQSNGIKQNEQSATLRTSKHLDELREHLTVNEWSLSTWITTQVPPSNEIPNLQPILIFGSGTVSRRIPTDPGCGGYYLAIAQYGEHLVFAFEDSDPAQSCRMIRMRNFELQSDVPVSLTITTSGLTTDLYIQGQPVMENITYAVDLTRLPMNQTLQLFPQVDKTDSTTEPFRGSIMQVSLFDETLNSEQVQQLFEEGIGQAAVVPLYLEAQASDTVVIEQDFPINEPTLIWLGGANTSTAVLPLSVEIQNVPTKGQLFTAGTNLLVNSTSLLIPINATGLWVEYRRPSDNFFTVPSMNAYGEILTLPHESFQYRVVARWEQRTLAASKPVTQKVHIQHVNHPPTWITTDEAVTSVVNNIPQYNFSFPTLLDEADQNLNRVRVDLSVLNGRISIKNETLHLADFDFCRNRIYSAWQCVGDGISDKGMSFVAVPGDIAHILAGLSYEGFVPGTEDTLIMNVYDGVGGQCLDEREHETWRREFRTESESQFSTIFRKCYHVQSNITIPSVRVNRGHRSEDSNWLDYLNLNFKEFGSADIAFWVVVFMLFYCVFNCIRDCCPNFLARGAGVTPDDYESEDETEDAEEGRQSEIDNEETSKNAEEGLQSEIENGDATSRPSGDDIV